MLEIQKSYAKNNDRKNINREVNIHSPMGVTGNKTGNVPSRTNDKNNDLWDLD